MILFTGLLRIHYLISRVIAAILVFFFNFACKKFLVFGALARLSLAHRPEHR
jgi:putative flippase GtrA